ncbi:MAG: AAA-like domain protein [Methanocella sp. PtaU1.Bin125]|nr:MAG: AAA-like domain protein [Methanocella sp. PtaU1.Bin125]
MADTVSTGLFIAKSDSNVYLLPKMANRHGMIAGATGTGKTVSLQVMAERLSRIGVPVFMADVKTDLSGISQPGSAANARVMDRLKMLGITDYQFAGCPTTFWDVFGEMGHPVRATISDMGPLLLARLLGLNDTQAGVLNATFKIADDNGLLLLDLKDLRAMLQHVGDNAKEYKTQYGNVSTATVGAIQRQLLVLEQQGGDRFFGEPAFDIGDMFKVDAAGHGYVNILAADKLLQSPLLYSTFLLWLLSELYEQLPEAGDLEKPKLVFFFDEAHLLFDDAPKALLDRIELVVRLVRSKGVGVFFISQNPLDVPDVVLGQLGNRIQHALRAFTPRDQKAVKSAATTFRPNPALDVTKAITELQVGEALVSMLEANGNPAIVQRAFILPPFSQIGPITPQARQQLIAASPFYGKYEKPMDRDSAYEVLSRRVAAKSPGPAHGPAAEQRSPAARRPATRKSDSVETALIKSAGRAAASTLGREITRGILGTLFGGRR